MIASRIVVFAANLLGGWLFKPLPLQSTNLWLRAILGPLEDRLRMKLAKQVWITIFITCAIITLVVWLLSQKASATTTGVAMKERYWAFGVLLGVPLLTCIIQASLFSPLRRMEVLLNYLDARNQRDREITRAGEWFFNLFVNVPSPSNGKLEETYEGRIGGINEFISLLNSKEDIDPQTQQTYEHYFDAIKMKKLDFIGYDSAFGTARWRDFFLLLFLLGGSCALSYLSSILLTPSV